MTMLELTIPLVGCTLALAVIGKRIAVALERIAAQLSSIEATLRGDWSRRH